MCANIMNIISVILNALATFDTRYVAVFQETSSDSSDESTSVKTSANNSHKTRASIGDGDSNKDDTSSRSRRRRRRSSSGVLCRCCQEGASDEGHHRRGLPSLPRPLHDRDDRVPAADGAEGGGPSPPFEWQRQFTSI